MFLQTKRSDFMAALWWLLSMNVISSHAFADPQASSLTNRQQVLGARQHASPFSMAVQPQAGGLQAGKAFRLVFSKLPANAASLYLNVVSVSAEDEVTILYPNAYVADRQPLGTQTALPGDEDFFNLTIVPPLGDTLIAAFLTPQNLNLHDAAAEGSVDASAMMRQVKKITDFDTQGARMMVPAWQVQHKQHYFMAISQFTVTQ